MSKETFEEWFKSEGHGDFNSFSKDYYAGQWAPLIKHTWNHQQKKIDELEGEIENRKGQVHWKCIEIKTLTAQIELLTRCETGVCGEVIGGICQGCKNMAILEKDKEPVGGKEEN